jgi:hypothetical protein
VGFEDAVFDQFKGRTDRDFFAHCAARDVKLNLEALLGQKRSDRMSQTSPWRRSLPSKPRWTHACNGGR